jgi:hypothetical protein
MPRTLRANVFHGPNDIRTTVALGIERGSLSAYGPDYDAAVLSRSIANS